MDRDDSGAQAPATFLGFPASMTQEPADMHYIARQLKGMITELERLGYTHLEMSCETCGHVGTKSFFLLRTRGTIADEITFPAAVARIRCAKCRRKLPSTLIRPTAQYRTGRRSRSKEIRRDKSLIAANPGSGMPTGLYGRRRGPPSRPVVRLPRQKLEGVITERGRRVTARSFPGEASR